MPKYNIDHESTYSVNPFTSKAATNELQRFFMKELLKIIRENELTERQQEIMIMYYDDGLSMAEIGRMLGINRSSVHRRIQSSLRKIRKQKDFFEKTKKILDSLHYNMQQ